MTAFANRFLTSNGNANNEDCVFESDDKYDTASESGEEADLESSDDEDEDEDAELEYD